MFGAVPSEELAHEPARQVLEWPVVPTGSYAPGTYSRREYYLARLGPWARVVHQPRRSGEDDPVTRQDPGYGLAPPGRRTGRLALAVVPRLLGRGLH